MSINILNLIRNSQSLVWGPWGVPWSFRRDPWDENYFHHNTKTFLSFSVCRQSQCRCRAVTGTASASAAVRAGPREAGSGRALHYRALTGSQLHLHMNLEPVKLLTLLNFDPKYASCLIFCIISWKILILSPFAAFWTMMAVAERKHSVWVVSWTTAFLMGHQFYLIDHWKTSCDYSNLGLWQTFSWR